MALGYLHKIRDEAHLFRSTTATSLSMHDLALDEDLIAIKIAKKVSEELRLVLSNIRQPVKMPLDHGRLDSDLVWSGLFRTRRQQQQHRLCPQLMNSIVVIRIFL